MQTDARTKRGVSVCGSGPCLDALHSLPTNVKARQRQKRRIIANCVSGDVKESKEASERTQAAARHTSLAADAGGTAGCCCAAHSVSGLSAVSLAAEGMVAPFVNN